MYLQQEVDLKFVVHSKLEASAAVEQEVRYVPKLKKQVTDVVHFGNDNWNLVLHMLFGIRQSVVTV